MTHADVCPDPRLHWPDGVCRGEVAYYGRIRHLPGADPDDRFRDQWKCSQCEDTIITDGGFRVVKVIPLGMAAIEARR